jgi:hypothetical protein
MLQSSVFAVPGLKGLLHRLMRGRRETWSKISCGAHEIVTLDPMLALAFVCTEKDRENSESLRTGPGFAGMWPHLCRIGLQTL